MGDDLHRGSGPVRRPVFGLTRPSSPPHVQELCAGRRDSDDEGGVIVAIEAWGGTTLLVADEAGPELDGRGILDLVGEAFMAGATMVAVPAARLQPAFFDLRSGVAGDVLQVSSTYQVRLAIVGELPEPASSSAAFAALVRESNAGRQHWFLPSVDALRTRLEGDPA
jgi:hypothetical protein